MLMFLSSYIEVSSATKPLKQGSLSRSRAARPGSDLPGPRVQGHVRARRWGWEGHWPGSRMRPAFMGQAPVQESPECVLGGYDMCKLTSFKRRAGRSEWGCRLLCKFHPKFCQYLHVLGTTTTPQGPQNPDSFTPPQDRPQDPKQKQT